MRDGTPPPPGALVTILTGFPSIDAPEMWASFGLGAGPGDLADARAHAKAELRASRIGGWTFTHRTTADARGAFEIAVPPDLPPFHFKVDARFVFYPTRSRIYVLESREVEEEVVLILEPAGGIEGRLVGPNGAVVASGEVRLRSESDREWALPRPDVGRDGRFVIRGVRPGRYGVAASGEGCRSAYAADVEVRLGETTRLDFALPLESFIAGVVVDAAGRGVDGALVGANLEDRGGPGSADAAFPGLDQGLASTDASGAFRIGGLRAAAYRVVVGCDGLLPTERERIVEVPEGGGVGDLRLALEAGKSLAGRVVDDLGNAVAAASVLAQPDLRAPRVEGRRVRASTSQSCRAAADGTFRLTGLADSPLMVFAHGEGFGAVAVSAVEAGSEGLEIVVPRGASVSGVVRAADTGEPIPRLRVTLEPRNTNEISGRTLSTWMSVRRIEAPEGRFELGDLPPVAHDLTLFAIGFVPQRLELVDLASGERRDGLEVSLRRGSSARGMIVEKGSRAPVAGARVTDGAIDSPRDTKREFLPEGGERRSDLDGSFAIDWLEPGTVRLRASHESFGSGDISIEVRPGETIEGVVIELSKAR